MALAVVCQAFVHVHASLFSFSDTFVADVADALPSTWHILTRSVGVTSAFVGQAFVNVGAAFETDALADETVFALARP